MRFTHAEMLFRCVPICLAKVAVEELLFFNYQMVDALHEFCIGGFLGIRCLRRFVLFLNRLLLLGLSVKEVDTDNGNCQQEDAT